MVHELAFRNVLYDLSVVKYNGKINFKVTYQVEDYVLFGVIKTAALFCNNTEEEGPRQCILFKGQKGPEKGHFPTLASSCRGKKKGK